MSLENNSVNENSLDSTQDKCDLNKLFDLCKRSAKLDGWVAKTGMSGYCKELSVEVKEILDALEKKDYENLKEELGDAFMDLFEACILAESEGFFSVKDVFQSAISKIERRRPYIYGDKKISPEDSVKHWLIAKEKEKKSKK